MTDSITRGELEAFGKSQIGLPCPLHPNLTIKEGKWDLWCGGKLKDGTWCNGGSITDEFLTEYRKGKR